MKNNKEWPVLLLDEERVRKNVQRMKARADESSCLLRPHFKTHQSKEIGKWVKNAGVAAITVSSLGMAKYFADAGWKDILIAIPVNILLIDEIRILGEQLDRLILMADHPSVIGAIEGKVNADIVVEIDAGSNRTGVPYSDVNQVAEIIEKIAAAEGVNFAGLYSHCGHHYGSRSRDEILKSGNSSLDKILQIRNKLAPNADIYFGDTPYASVGNRFNEVAVMTPGNFVFYDIMQVEIGSCNYDDVAVCLASPVISIHPERSELAVHAGGVHLAKDTLDDGSYGRIVRLTSSGWTTPLEGYKVRSISQEHGIVRLPQAEISQWKIGDVLGILPVHSCMTAEAMGSYQLLAGGEIDHYRKKKPV